MKKLRDAVAMLAAGKELAVVLHTLEVSEATLARYPNDNSRQDECHHNLAT